MFWIRGCENVCVFNTHHALRNIGWALHGRGVLVTASPTQGMMVVLIRIVSHRVLDRHQVITTCPCATPQTSGGQMRIHHKRAVTHAPQLRFPDFNMPFYLATDASCVGIGGVLYQPSDEDHEDITQHNIVAICSKKLNPCQRRYSTYKKELYGVVCMRQFHQYIWGHQLVIITDHKPLV